MIKPLFTWLKGRPAPGAPSRAAASGVAAGRREVAAIASLREETFTDREEAALHAQLARAPRDANALFGLLAWHARRGDRQQVASFARALWDETDAEGGLWQRAAQLGRAIDPDNPLYSDDPFAALSQAAAQSPAASPAACTEAPFGEALAAFAALDLAMATGEEQADTPGLAVVAAPSAAEARNGRAPAAGGAEAEGGNAGNSGNSGNSGNASSSGNANNSGNSTAGWLDAQTACLPAAVLALDLDLGEPASPPTSRSASLGALSTSPRSRRRNRNAAT